jgi:hypothetical protein
METRAAKKIKLQEIQLESSLDPLLKVHPDIHYMIFQHLSFEDVIKGSEVSTAWNSAIGTSSKCLSKIQLNLNQSQNESNRKELINIKREYRSMRLTLLNKQKSNEALHLMQKLASNLLDLKIRFNFEKIENFPELVDFPKLACLDITGLYESKPIVSNGFRSFSFQSLKLQIDRYFKNVTTLKKLRMCFELTEDSQLSDWILKQHQLEELTFRRWWGNIFENDLLAEASFPLRSFKFLGNSTPTQTENFHKFLLKMSDSLKFLSILKADAETVEFAVNNLPNLKKLHCYQIEGDIDNLQLKPNDSITELKLRHHNTKHTEALFKSLVNLEVLKTSGIDEDDLKWIFRNMKTLKKLNVQLFKIWSDLYLIEQCVAVYEELKESGEEINRDIEITSECKSY